MHHLPDPRLDVTSIGSVGVIQILLSHRSSDAPVPYGGDNDLADADEGVAGGEEVPVPERPDGEEEVPKEGGGGGDPERLHPLALVLHVGQRGDGEDAAEVVGDEEVAEEGGLGFPLPGVGLVELVGAERGHRRLVRAVPQRDLVDGDVEDGGLHRRRRLAVLLPAPAVAEVARLVQEHVAGHGQLHQSLMMYSTVVYSVSMQQPYPCVYDMTGSRECKLLRRRMVRTATKMSWKMVQALYLPQ